MQADKFWKIASEKHLQLLVKQLKFTEQFS